jgi:hypothetical protein
MKEIPLLTGGPPQQSIMMAASFSAAVSVCVRHQDDAGYDVTAEQATVENSCARATAHQLRRWATYGPSSVLVRGKDHRAIRQQGAALRVYSRPDAVFRSIITIILRDQ